MATELVPSLVTGAGAAVGLVAAVLSARAFGNVRLLREAAPTPIGELDEGLHEVAGAVAAEGELTSPLTGRSCVWYRLLLEQRRRNRWETVLDQKDALDGALVDGTGRVRIALADADVVVASPDRVRGGIFTVPSAELTALLEKVAPPAIPPTGPFLRWREEILAAGDRTFAVGVAQRHEEEWTLRPPEEGEVLVSDREEAEVVRHQRRAGQRWGTVAALAFGVAAYGGFRLLGG